MNIYRRKKIQPRKRSFKKDDEAQIKKRKKADESSSGLPNASPSKKFSISHIKDKGSNGESNSQYNPAMQSTMLPNSNISKV